MLNENIFSSSLPTPDLLPLTTAISVTDRRKETRFEQVINVDLKFLNSDGTDTLDSAKTINVSENGVCLKTYEQLDLHQEVSLWIPGGFAVGIVRHVTVSPERGGDLAWVVGIEIMKREGEWLIKNPEKF